MSMAKIKIMIADDHAFVREGTRRILEQEPDLQVIAEAGDGEEAVKFACDLKPDVALLDVAMPRLDGVEATRRIKAVCPSVAVLVLSAYDDDQFVFGLLEAGAAGYLLKNVRGQEIVNAIRAVHAGESVLHPSVARKVLNRFAGVPPKTRQSKSLDVLTEREMEVLKMVTKGLSNKDIADGLYLSVRTVQGHLANIFNKLRVSSRTEAVVLALREGWVTLDDVP
jgi:DNA-binding NarL/FixJ family response regulator